MRASSCTAASFRPTSVLSPVHNHQRELRGPNKHTKQSLYPRVCPRRRMYPCLGVKRGLVAQLTRRSQLPESTITCATSAQKARQQCQGVQKTSRKVAAVLGSNRGTCEQCSGWRCPTIQERTTLVRMPYSNTTGRRWSSANTMQR